MKRKVIMIGLLVALALLSAAGVWAYGQYQAWQTRRTVRAAEQQLTSGQATEAEMALGALMETAGPRDPGAAELVDLRLRALAALGDRVAAQQVAASALDPDAPWVRSGDPGWARAHTVLGNAALDQNDLAGARAHFEPVAALPAGAPGRGEAQLGLGLIALATPGEARTGVEQLQALLTTMPANDPARPEVEHALGVANMALLMNPQPGPDDELYSIQKGDTLDGLRKKFKISPELLMRVNNIQNPRNLSIGRRMKIPNLELSAVVNKADNTLTLYNHGKFFKKYQVRTGESDYMTPVGDYAVRRKVVDPAWTDPKSGQSFAPGAPGNQLGARWMEIQGSIGIHEAVDPETIGTYSSSGCVGLVRDDVVELYDLLALGTPVKIVGERKPTTAINTKDVRR